ASEVLTQGFRLSPFFTAFRASSPAPIITEGLEVLVQLVIAAMTTEPSASSNRLPSYSTSARIATSWATATAEAGVWPPSPLHRVLSFSGTGRRAPWGIRFGRTWRNEA